MYKAFLCLVAYFWSLVFTLLVWLCCRLWDIECGACLRVLEGHEELVRCIRFDSKRIVSGAYDGYANLFEFIYPSQESLNSSWKLEVQEWYMKWKTTDMQIPDLKFIWTHTTLGNLHRAHFTFGCSSVPWPIWSWGGRDRWFSRDPSWAVLAWTGMSTLCCCPSGMWYFLVKSCTVEGSQ